MRAPESMRISSSTREAWLKASTSGRTRTEVEALSEASRVEELMRMLSGARSENARRLALDLVNAARAEQKRPAA